MDLIRTSIRITKTIRNAARLREIVLILARNGFAEFISLGVLNKIPDFVLPKSKKNIREEMKKERNKDWNQVVGFRLRKSFEELGPAFIKFGQLLSTREDIFDELFINEMKQLRNKVEPVPFSKVAPEIEKAIGGKLEDTFREIDKEPIGTASIGVAFRGILKTGETVVIKVRRPGIKKMIEVDFSIMRFLIGQAEKAGKDIKFLGISRIISDFAVSLQTELNFNIEAVNCQRFKEILETYDPKGIYVVPKVYKNYTKENVLIVEFLEGIPFSDVEKIAPRKDTIGERMVESVSIFLKTFLSEGFFHADLHGGNFFLMPDDRIGLIDYGLMGRLSKKGRKSLVAVIYSLLTFNYENLVYEFLEVAEYEKIPDIDALIRDIRDTLNPHTGLTTRQIDYDIVLQNIFKALNQHQLYLPREWFIVFRAMTTLDGVNRSLDLDFDLYSIMKQDIHEIIKSNFSKDELMEEGVWAVKDVLDLTRVLPRHFKWFLKEWTKKGHAFELNLKGYEQHLTNISKSLTFLGHSLITSVFIISGTIILPKDKAASLSDLPPICLAFWGLGLIVFLWGVLSKK